MHIAWRSPLPGRDGSGSATCEGRCLRGRHNLERRYGVRRDHTNCAANTARTPVAAPPAKRGVPARNSVKIPDIGLRLLFTVDFIFPLLHSVADNLTRCGTTAANEVFTAGFFIFNYEL